MHLDGRARTHLGIQRGRDRLQAVLLKGQRITVRVKVIRQDVDGHHAVGARQDRVGHGHRILVERRSRGHGHSDVARGTGALAVLDRVGEGIGPGRRSVRRVLDPRGMRGRAALLRRGFEAAQDHRIAVRVDAVERDGDAHALAGRGPGGDVARARRLVRVRGGQDLEGDRARGPVAGRIDDRVGDLHHAGSVSGLETDLVTRHERRAQRVGSVVFEGRLHLKIQTSRGTVVRQDGDRAHVAHADLRAVRLEDRRQVGAIRGAGNNGHLGARAALTVGDRVAEGDGLVQAGGRGHAQEVAVDKRNLEAGDSRGVNRRDRQDATHRVEVVGQRRDQHGPSLRQDGRVVLGDGRRGVRLDDLDAHDAQRRRGAIGHRVGKGVRARRRGHEIDGPALQIRRDRSARGRAGHRGQRQRVAVGVRVVLERVKRDVLARVSLEQVAVRRGRQVARLLDVDDELAARLAALIVSDGQNDGLRAGRAALLVNRQRTILHEGHAQALGGLRVLQVDRVTVGVAPVGQRLVLNLRAGADLDRGRAQLHGGLVLPVGMDRHLHPGGGGRTPVRGIVGEGRRTRLIRAHIRNL